MAIVIAISASVTVSIGELTSGVDRRSFFVRFVVRSTCMRKELKSQAWKISLYLEKQT